MVAQGGKIKLDNTLDSRLELISHQVSDCLILFNTNGYSLPFLHNYFALFNFRGYWFF